MRFFGALAALLPVVLGAPTAFDEVLARASNFQGLPSNNSAFSGDVTACQGPSPSLSINLPQLTRISGYMLGSVTSTPSGGLTATLSILSSCKAYGTDLPSLTVAVEYETVSRLHVHIYDTPLHQYQVSNDFLPRPARTLSGSDSADKSDLEFSYNSSPFEFWITRKSDGQVLFDTRAKNIPVHDDQVILEGVLDQHTVLPAYPLVFEDQYLQIASALPVGANIFGLGEVIVSVSGVDDWFRL